MGKNNINLKFSGQLHENVVSSNVKSFKVAWTDGSMSLALSLLESDKWKCKIWSLVMEKETKRFLHISLKAQYGKVTQFLS